jgi:hypothetical protein
MNGPLNLPWRYGIGDDAQCYFDSPAEVVRSEVLEFCGCGNGGSLEWIRDGLALIDEKSPTPTSREIWQNWYADYRKRCDEHFKDPEIEYFFYYWCDKEKLTEHGGSVPGWLDSDGKKLLALLTAVLEADEHAQQL